MKYVELTKAKVSQDMLNSFDCGHPDFNDFLINDAPNYTANGEGVTYILGIWCLSPLKKYKQARKHRNSEKYMK